MLQPQSPLSGMGFAGLDISVPSRTHLEAHTHNSMLNVGLWFSAGVLSKILFKSKGKAPSILTNFWALCVLTQFDVDNKKGSVELLIPKGKVIFVSHPHRTTEKLLFNLLILL